MKKRAFWIAVLPVLLFSAWLRFTPVNWDSLQLPHPDERYVVWVASTIKLPHSFSEFMDVARSPMNPFRWPPEDGQIVGKERDFAYGHLPLYVFAFAPRAVKWLIPRMAWLMPSGWRSYLLFIAPHLSELEYIPLVGRPIVALFDLCTLLLVALLARRLYGDAAGWLAAAFYGLTVMQIQLSHFATTDLIMTFWVVWTVFWSAKRAESESSLPTILAGIGYGFAVSSKFSASMLVLPILTGIWLARKEDGVPAVLEEAAEALAIAFLAFAFTSPYALLDYRHYLSNIASQGEMVRGKWDVPYTRQYAHTLPYLYQGKQLVMWGMGVPLGMLSLIAFGWQLWRIFKRRAGAAEIVVMAWLLPTVLVVGSFYAKFMRYMAPLVPFLTVYAAGFAVHGWKELRKRRTSLLADGWAVIVLLVAVLTLLWAVAFHNIYRETHTWVRASLWIYQHVPAGSTILNEEWDDSLPLALDGSGISVQKPHYKHLSIPAYAEDSWKKQEKLVNLLQDGDYIAIASRRLYKTIGRLPDRYPMMSLYYRRLFDGELGYEKVAEFQDYPHIGRFVIRDDSADESFVVYDHPHPIIFEKTKKLPASELGALLTPSEWHKGVVWVRKVETPWRWNRLGERYPPVAAAIWWIMVLLIGLSAWPLTYAMFPNMRDRGWGFARLIGWAVIGYGNWIAASTGAAKNGTIPLLATWALLLLGWLLWRSKRSEMLRFLIRRRKLILAEEALWLASLLLFLGFRILDPDLWQPWFGGEKFMELAFLHATIRTDHFPPYDPYFAYGTMNYYYYGLYLVGVLSRLSGIFPRVSFNLAIPMLFASTTTSVFSLAYSLASRKKALSAGISVLATAFWGNLAGVKELFDAIKRVGGLSKALHAHAIPYSYWNPSRVIPFTINEFPYWSFLFADLHPHLIAIPFTVLYLALMWEFWAGNESILLMLASGFAMGLLAVSNTWNLPLAVGMFLLVILLKLLRRRATLRTAASFVVVLGVGAISYLPFFLHYSPVGSHGIGIARSGNPLGYWLLIWGLFVAIVAGYLLVVLWRKSSQAIASLPLALASFAVLGFSAILLRSGRSVAGLLCVLLALLAWAILTFRSPRRVFAGALMFAAVATLFALEFLYVRDFLDGGDWYRMNTLFKFGIQAWVLAGIAVGVMVGEVWDTACRAFKLLVEMSIALGLVFVLLGTPSRLADRFPGARPRIGTLDGMAYMSVGEYRWKDHTIKLKYDYEAINWLWDHVSGTPVEAEAPLDYYRAGALRVSSFTGFPTLLGQHEPEQRSWNEVLPRREEAVAVFSDDPDIAWKAIRRMWVRFIYEGQIERIAYPGSDRALAELARRGRLEIVYENPGVTIYRLK